MGKINNEKSYFHSSVKNTLELLLCIFAHHRHFTDNSFSKSLWGNYQFIHIGLSGVVIGGQFWLWNLCFGKCSALPCRRVVSSQLNFIVDVIGLYEHNSIYQYTDNTPIIQWFHNHLFNKFILSVESTGCTFFGYD